MGINFILPLIAGIVMTVILGTQVAPSLVENMKIAKVENRTISNQNLIKDAIVRYIKINGVVPVSDPENPKGPLEDLKKSGLLKDYHESNIFDGGYSFYIDLGKGTLTIFTTINDNGAGKYFSNTLKFPNKPNCKQALDSNGVCVSGEFETFYLLDEETFETIKSIATPSTPPPSTHVLGSIDDIKDRFTAEKLGDKEYYKENPPKDGDKDYVYVAEDKVEEFTYDEINNEWVSNGEKVVGGIGRDTNVFISDLEWSFSDRLGNEIKQKHEKVHCENTTLELGTVGVEVFVVNENTKLGEIVWVAPLENSVSAIQTKIFGSDNTSTSPVVYTPNNICTSKVSNMAALFDTKTNFNSPLNRWDVSNVTSMYYMFQTASIFNQALNNWDVSNVTDMSYMFQAANKFNKPLNNWDVSKVTNMSYMFREAIIFNQDINDWNVSNVTNMRGMFLRAKKFDEALDKWNVSNVTNMGGVFAYTEDFNQDISNWVVSKVTNMNEMFNQANSFNQALNWNVGNVIYMNWMFYKATSFNKDLSKWCVSEIKSEPFNFSVDSPLLPSFKPNWETCLNP